MDWSYHKFQDKILVVAREGTSTLTAPYLRKAALCGLDVA